MLGPLAADGGGDGGIDDQSGPELPSSLEQPSGTVCHCGEHHIVHLRAVGARDRLNAIEVRSDEHQPAVLSNRAVEGEARGAPFVEEAADLAQGQGDATDDGDRLSQLRHGSGPRRRHPAHVVGEELPATRCGPRHPPSWRRGRCIRSCVEQSANQREGGNAVGDYVMQAEEHPQLAIVEPRQQPQLPQRTRPVQSRLIQRRRHLEQGCLVARSGNGSGPHVLADVEAAVIDPQGLPQAESRAVEDLAQARGQIQAPLDVRPYGVQPKLSRGIEERCSLQDGQRCHMHGQPVVLHP